MASAQHQGFADLGLIVDQVAQEKGIDKQILIREAAARGWDRDPEMLRKLQREWTNRLVEEYFAREVSARIQRERKRGAGLFCPRAATVEEVQRSLEKGARPNFLPAPLSLDSRRTLWEILAFTVETV